MVYYVAYHAPSELKQRSRMAGHLRALGCRQIRRSFWEVDRESIRTVAKVLQKSSPVILKRVREIRKPSFTKEMRCSELGSLVVIAYKVPQKTMQDKVKTMLKRTPCIRLARGVYAFSQLHKRFDKGRGLVDARSFWEFIREIDESAVVVPRVIAVNNPVVERLLEEAERRVVREVDNITEAYKIVLEKVKIGEIDGRRAPKMTRKLRLRFANVKKVAAFYEEWLKIDLSNVLIRPYPAMREVRSLLHEKYGAT